MPCNSYINLTLSYAEVMRNPERSSGDYCPLKYWATKPLNDVGDYYQYVAADADGKKG